MLGVIVTSFLALIVLIITEIAANQKKLSIELSRKIPHLAGSLTVASWPFFVSFHTVAILGVALTVAAFATRALNLFPHSRYVERPSWGELWFGIGVALSALIAPNKWVFLAAMLYLGLADGVAALVGTRRGKRKYKVFGVSKTIEGSVAFLVTAMVITAGVVFIAPTDLELLWPVIIWLPLVSTCIEAFAPFGLDNVLLPVYVAAVFSLLQP